MHRRKAREQTEVKIADNAVRFFIVGGPIYKTQGSQFTLGELRARYNEEDMEEIFVKIASAGEASLGFRIRVTE